MRLSRTLFVVPVLAIAALFAGEQKASAHPPTISIGVGNFGPGGGFGFSYTNGPRFGPSFGPGYAGGFRPGYGGGFGYGGPVYRPFPVYAPVQPFIQPTFVPVVPRYYPGPSIGGTIFIR
jgi:hypothetical protein